MGVGVALFDISNGNIVSSAAQLHLWNQPAAVNVNIANIPLPTEEERAEMREIDRRLPLQRPNRCQPVARISRERVEEPVGTLVEALKLANAPDLGFRNCRFQNVPFCFKND
jgi:hypothetical protein